jgi:hypothetical protein
MLEVEEVRVSQLQPEPLDGSATICNLELEKRALLAR